MTPTIAEATAFRGALAASARFQSAAAVQRGGGIGMSPLQSKPLMGRSWTPSGSASMRNSQVLSRCGTPIGRLGSGLARAGEKKRRSRLPCWEASVGSSIGGSAADQTSAASFAP